MNGILIGVEPVIFRQGPFTLRWFGLLLVAALAAGVWLTIRRAERVGFQAHAVTDLALWALPVGFLGARVLHLAENWEFYVTQPSQALDMAIGGLNAWGALAAGGPLVWLLCRRRSLPADHLADAAAPGLAVADAVGRVGCFLNGDGQGRPSGLPWATRYTSNNALTPDFGVPRHPAQVYQLLADLAILGLLWLLRNARLRPGTFFWVWLGLYGSSRVLIGVVRLDPPFLFGLQQAQLIGLAAVTLSAFAMIRPLFRDPRPLRAAS